MKDNLNDIKFMCPHCKGNVSHINYKNAIRIDKNIEYGDIYVYQCPYCNKEFDNMTVEGE